MRNPNSSWLWAAITPIGVAIAKAATIIRLIPGTTIIDTGALIVTGFLAGLLAAFHIARPHAAS